MRTILITIQIPDGVEAVVSTVEAPQRLAEAPPPVAPRQDTPAAAPPPSVPPACPTHGPGYIKHNARGLYCARRLPDGQWCPYKG